MASNNSGEIQLNEPIGSVLGIESHLFSTRTADFFRGFDPSDGSAISFWIMRAELTSSEAQKFISRLSQIEDLRLPNCPMRGYGVDPEGRGFAIFPAVDASSIVSGGSNNLDTREAERRFVPCLQTLEKLHASEIILGDLCSSSFIIDRTGRILFIGVMGDLVDGKASPGNEGDAVAIPADIFQFVAPEQREAGASTFAADVYAIGVLGYRLFSNKYPFPGLSPTQFSTPSFKLPEPSPIVSANNSIPQWCNEVFLKCMHHNVQVRFSSATELTLAIQSLRQKSLFASEAPLIVNRQLGPGSGDEKKSQKRQEGPTTFKPLGERDDEDEDFKNKSESSLAKKLLLIAITLTVLFLCLVVVFYTKQPKKPEVVLTEETPIIEDLISLKAAGTESKIKDAIDVIAQRQSPLEDRSKKLQDLIDSDDPIAHEVLITSAVGTEELEFRDLVEKSIIHRVKRLGGTRSSEQLRQWLRTIPAGPLPEDYEAMLKAVNPQQPIAARESLLRQVYPKNSRFALRFAAAMALDSQNPREFQPVVSQLYGDVLNLSDANTKSVYALILAVPEVAEVFGDDIISRKSEIPDADLSWVLAILATRNDSNVRQFAEMTLERGQISPLRKVFLDAINEREDLPLEIIISLVRAGSDQTTSDDITQFGGWIDGLSERVLLALCAELKDPKLLSEAFETLAAKPLTITPAIELVDVIHTKYWDQRNELAPLVAVASLPGVVPEKTIDELLEKLVPFVQDAKFIELFASSQDPYLSKAIIERYSENLGLGSLLKLLNNGDKQIRMRAISALKRFNEIGALKLILAQYDKEKDPDVIKAYRDNFWMISEREARKN